MSGLERLGDTESSKSIDLILLDRKLLLKNKNFITIKYNAIYNSKYVLLFSTNVKVSYLELELMELSLLGLLIRGFIPGSKSSLARTSS